MPRAVAVAACAALSLALSLVLQGCGAQVKDHADVAPPVRQKAAPAPPPPPIVKKNDYIKSLDESAVPESKVPECPGFVLKDNHGDIHVLPSRIGKSPTILCPSDYEYNGPRIECSWVDQLCQVQGLDDDVTKGQCALKYDLTHEGKGLVRWPKRVMPRLVSDRRNPDGAVDFNAGKRDVAALPAVIKRGLIGCKREGYVDLDFEHAKTRETFPPYSQDAPWSKVYEGITALDNRKVDMLVMRSNSLDPPGNVWLDGNSSATGRINIAGRGASTLKFQFVESGTLRLVALKKFFFTIFDLSDGKDGKSNKKVRASGMAEYYLSRSTQLQANKTEGDSYEFEGGSGLHRDEEVNMGTSEKFSGADGREKFSDLESNWLSSLERTVVFMFRNTATFSIQVEAVPFPNGQVLEFAGWSELVGQGARVPTLARKAADGQEVVIRDALSDEPFVDEVTSAFSKPSGAQSTPIADALLPSHRWAWAKMAVATSAFSLAVGLVACVLQLRRGCSDVPQPAPEVGSQGVLELYAAE